jgi:hypothetical protein
MNDQIDDLMILGFCFEQQQLEDLLEAINVSLWTFDNFIIDSNKALTNRLHTIRERIEYMIEQMLAYKQGGD